VTRRRPADLRALLSPALLPGAACAQGSRWQLFDARAEDEPREQASERHTAAMWLCVTCPVRADCRALAEDYLDRGVPVEGVWAGRVRHRRSRPRSGIEQPAQRARPGAGDPGGATARAGE